jgi:hypothetical protein
LRRKNGVTDVIKTRIVGNIVIANHASLLPGVIRRISPLPGLGGCISRNF